MSKYYLSAKKLSREIYSVIINTLDNVSERINAAGDNEFFIKELDLMLGETKATVNSLKSEVKSDIKASRPSEYQKNRPVPVVLDTKDTCNSVVKTRAYITNLVAQCSEGYAYFLEPEVSQNQYLEYLNTFVKSLDKEIKIFKKFSENNIIVHTDRKPVVAVSQTPVTHATPVPGSNLPVPELTLRERLTIARANGTAQQVVQQIQKESSSLTPTQQAYARACNLEKEGKDLLEKLTETERLIVKHTLKPLVQLPSAGVSFTADVNVESAEWNVKKIKAYTESLVLPTIAAKNWKLVKKHGDAESRRTSKGFKQIIDKVLCGQVLKIRLALLSKAGLKPSPEILNTIEEAGFELSSLHYCEQYIVVGLIERSLLPKIFPKEVLGDLELDWGESVERKEANRQYSIWISEEEDTWPVPEGFNLAASHPYLYNLNWNSLDPDIVRRVSTKLTNYHKPTLAVIKKMFTAETRGILTARLDKEIRMIEKYEHISEVKFMELFDNLNSNGSSYKSDKRYKDPMTKLVLIEIAKYVREYFEKNPEDLAAVRTKDYNAHFACSISNSIMDIMDTTGYPLNSIHCLYRDISRVYNESGGGNSHPIDLLSYILTYSDFIGTKGLTRTASIQIEKWRKEAAKKGRNSMPALFLKIAETYMSNHQKTRTNMLDNA